MWPNFVGERERERERERDMLFYLAQSSDVLFFFIKKNLIIFRTQIEAQILTQKKIHNVNPYIYVSFDIYHSRYNMIHMILICVLYDSSASSKAL